MDKFIFGNLPDLIIAQNEQVDIAYDLDKRLSGEQTLSSATATLTDPDGTTSALVTAVTITGTKAIARITPAELEAGTTGVWVLEVLATLSTGEKRLGQFTLSVEGFNE